MIQSKLKQTLKDGKFYSDGIQMSSETAKFIVKSQVAGTVQLQHSIAGSEFLTLDTELAVTANTPDSWVHEDVEGTVLRLVSTVELSIVALY